MIISDWDDAYANRAHVPGSDTMIARWGEDAAKFREAQLASAMNAIPAAFAASRPGEGDVDADTG